MKYCTSCILGLLVDISNESYFVFMKTDLRKVIDFSDTIIKHLVKPKPLKLKLFL